MYFSAPVLTSTEEGLQPQLLGNKGIVDVSFLRPKCFLLRPHRLKLLSSKDFARYLLFLSASDPTLGLGPFADRAPAFDVNVSPVHDIGQGQPTLEVSPNRLPLLRRERHQPTRPTRASCIWPRFSWMYFRQSSYIHSFIWAEAASGSNSFTGLPPTSTVPDWHFWRHR